MIDETILLNYIGKIYYKLLTAGNDHGAGHNEALDIVEKFISKMPKTDPIIIKPDDEEIRNKLRDLEFERDFYKYHFEELLQRKVEG